MTHELQSADVSSLSDRELRGFRPGVLHDDGKTLIAHACMHVSFTHTAILIRMSLRQDIL